MSEWDFKQKNLSLTKDTSVQRVNDKFCNTRDLHSSVQPKI